VIGYQAFDSTAESIKSLEGFDIAWVEEAPGAHYPEHLLREREIRRKQTAHKNRRFDGSGSG
jgi:hypothetical protein